MTVHSFYVRMVARARVFDGYSRVIDAGTDFQASGRRAASLIAIGAAELLDADDDEAVAAVVMYADDDEVVRLRDARTARAIRDAWAEGVRPTLSASREQKSPNSGGNQRSGDFRDDEGRNIA